MFFWEALPIISTPFSADETIKDVTKSDLIVGGIIAGLMPVFLIAYSGEFY